MQKLNQDVVADYLAAVELSQQAKVNECPQEQARLNALSNQQLIAIIDNLAMYSMALGEVANKMQDQSAKPQRRALQKLSRMTTDLQAHFTGELALAVLIHGRVSRELEAALGTDAAGMASLLKKHDTTLFPDGDPKQN